VQASEAIGLASNRLLFSVPIHDRGAGTRANVHVLCGVDDDFKGRLDKGKCRFLNAPIERWMKARKVSAEEIWPRVEQENRTLWTARLFVASSEDGLAETIASLEHGREMRGWRSRKRYSMAMLLEQADTAAMTAARQAMSARLQTAAYLLAVRDGLDVSADSFLSRYATGEAYRAAIDLLKDFATTSNTDANAALRAARALWCCAELSRRPDHPQINLAPDADAFASAAFDKIAQASELGHRAIRAIKKVSGARVEPGIEVRATSPVRLDLAGGWSDTPPYCFERGGQVVNVAIDLDGQPPVRATVQTLPEKCVRLESCDLGQCVELDCVGPKRCEPIRLDDPFALHKVALEIAGLERVGLHVTTECRVPKGSGLGTSSILAATLLAALHGVKSGRGLSRSMLIEQTQLLEQRLSTGGGWQDQVGGVVDGIKFTHSAPGVPQKLSIDKVNLSEARLEAFEQRLVVYYTGQQRLARDILRRVMGRWLSREPAIVALMGQLKASAKALNEALRKFDVAKIAAEINRYWQIKKELHPGSTTAVVDELFLRMRPNYLACGLAGAGGGGFAYFFCASEKQAGRLRHALSQYAARPGAMGAVYDARISRNGLVVKREWLMDNGRA